MILLDETYDFVISRQGALRRGEESLSDELMNQQRAIFDKSTAIQVKLASLAKDATATQQAQNPAATPKPLTFTPTRPPNLVPTVTPSGG